MSKEIKFKQHAINTQKNIIADLRETGTETSREKEIEKLNLMVDDYEKDNSKISKDNIHLYYEFMSDKDIYNYHYTIDEILDDRTILIYETLNIDSEDLIDKYTVYDVGTNYHFGIKDTLKPIDEYITEIKNSEQYKNYLANK